MDAKLLVAFILCIANSNSHIFGLGRKENISWTHQVTFPGDGEFAFKWTNTDPDWITMEIRAKTKGYVGIGFSPKGGMPGSGA